MLGPITSAGEAFGACKVLPKCPEQLADGKILVTVEVDGQEDDEGPWGKKLE